MYGELGGFNFWGLLIKHGPLEEEIATHSSILAWRTPQRVWKGKKIWHQKLRPSPPHPQVRSCPICYRGSAEGNSSKKNELAGPKWKWHSIVDVSDGESKVWWYKGQYCIGTWNVQLMNQGKLGIVKQKMARVNIDILGISGLIMDRNGWI